METKICTKCGNEYPKTIEFWYKQKRNKDGLNYICKICCAISQKEYQNNPDNKESRKRYGKKWCDNNREKIAEKNLKRRLLHGEGDKKKKREKYRNDTKYREKISESQKIYYKSGGGKELRKKPEYIRKMVIKNKLIRRRRKSDPIFAMKSLNSCAKYREENRDIILEMGRKRRRELSINYIAGSILKIPIKNLTPEIIETKRLIIKIKRELKQLNIK